MPIYEYECADCGHVIEVMQKVSARAPGRCEKCSGKLNKKVSVTSFQLKGGGWYSDGYGDRGPAKAADDTPAPKKEKKKDAKSSKPKKTGSS